MKHTQNIQYMKTLLKGSYNPCFPLDAYNIIDGFYSQNPQHVPSHWEHFRLSLAKKMSTQLVLANHRITG